MTAIVTSKTREIIGRPPRWPFALDRSSPFAHGMFAFYLPTRNGSVSAPLFDAWSGRQLGSSVNATAPIVRVTPHGYAFAGVDAGATSYVLAPSPRNPSTLTQTTILSWYSPAAINFQAQITGHSGVFNHITRVLNTGQFYTYVSSGGTRSLAGPILTVNPATPHQLAFVWNGASGKAGANGTFGTPVNFTFLNSTTADYRLFNHESVTNSPARGPVHAVAYWDRALSDGEIGEIRQIASLWGELLKEYGRRTIFLPLSATAGTTINANASSITLAGQVANVNAAKNISANTNTLQLLAQAASIGVGTNINAQVAAIQMAAQAATVNAARNIGANVASIALVAQNASVVTGNLISAGVASITLAGQAASINAARNIAANTAALNINALAASVSLGVATPPNATTFSGWNVAKRVILPATNDWRTLHVALTNELQQVWTRASDMAERTTKIDTSSIVAHGLVLADASSATVAVTLVPAADWSNRTIRVKKTDATSNTVLIVPQSGETVDGAATKTISTQYSVVTVYSDGQQWHIV